MTETTIVNLFAGPGAGKSTIMAELFALLKWNKVNCEMAPEWYKEQIWDNNTNIDQIYIFAKQLRRLQKLVGNVDIVITDSPLLMSLIYDVDQNWSFGQLVRDKFHLYNNVNFFLNRTKKYNPAGRLQTEEEAIAKDQEVRKMLELDSTLNFVDVEACSQGAAEEIFEYLKDWKMI